MFKIIALIGLGGVLALPPGAALAQQGTSSSWGSVGRGPVLPTISLTGKERSWNDNHEAQYRSEDAAEWLRLHSQAGQSPWLH